MALTSEEYKMTREEMMSGAEGQAAYTARIAALREGRTPAPTPTPTTLTQAQINQYLATEGQKANPLSPTVWLAQQKAQGSLSPEQIESVKETLKRASEITKTHVYSEPTKNIEADKLEETQIETPTTPPKTEATQQIMTESQAFSNWFQQEQQRIAKEQEAAAKKREEQLAKLETQIEERPSMEKLIEEQREEYKVPEFYDKLVSLTPEIDALNNKLIEVETREQNMLMGAEQRMAPMTFIRGEQALIQRQFAVEKTAVSAELGAKTALAETYKGNINMANTLINQTIEAQLYDYNQKIDDYKYFFDYYDDHYKGLDSELKSNIEKQYNLLMAQEQVEREDLQNKYSLIQSAWQLGIDPALTAQDIKSKSYEEIMSRVGPEIQKVAGTSEIKELMARYPTAGITEDDTYAQAVGKVAEMLEEDQNDATTREVSDAQKIFEIAQFMTSRMGEDGYISAETYVESQQKWIGLGGNITDFKAAFPPESVMGEWELIRLPSSIWKSSATNDIQNEDLVE
jgi:hypothetical protein